MHDDKTPHEGLRVRMRKLRVRSLAAAAILTGLLGATITTAPAAAHLRRDSLGHGVVPATAGIVQATPPSGATSFTIETRAGTTETVDIAGSTTYLERGTPTASLSDVQQGDLVAVFGTVTSSTVTATEVVIAAPRSGGTHQTPAAAGVVAATPAPGATSFTITTSGGSSETVDVSGPTTYMERGTPSASLSDLQQGDLVAVFGTTSGSTVTATLVVICPDIHRGFALAGVVQGTPAPGATSFTIETRGGLTATVDVTGTTRYFERGAGSVTLASVASGEVVGVFGTPSGSDTITAAAVLIAASPTTGTGFATAGTVQTQPSGGEFVIETCNHTQITVDTTGATTYLEWGSTGGSLSDVAVGDDVAVFGAVSGSTISATQIVIGGDERDHPGHFSGAQQNYGSTGASGWQGHGGQGGGQQNNGGGQSNGSQQGSGASGAFGDGHRHGHRIHSRRS